MTQSQCQVQCQCSNPKCGCSNIDTKPEPTETPAPNAPTQPTGPPPPSKCKSDNGYQCLTKEEVEFYFSLDEALDGGDPCFDTPLTGTKVLYIRGIFVEGALILSHFRGVSSARKGGSQTGAGTPVPANLSVVATRLELNPYCF